MQLKREKISFANLYSQSGLGSSRSTPAPVDWSRWLAKKRLLVFHNFAVDQAGTTALDAGWQLRLPQRQYKQRRSCLSKLSVFFVIRFDTVSDLVSFEWQNRFSRKPSVFWQQYAECVSRLRNNPIAAHLEQGN